MIPPPIIDCYCYWGKQVCVLLRWNCSEVRTSPQDCTIYRKCDDVEISALLKTLYNHRIVPAISKCFVLPITVMALFPLCYSWPALMNLLHLHLWGEQLIGYAKMWYLNTHYFCNPLQSWACRNWLTDSVYYSLSLTERISKGGHRSPVSEDLINRTCHIPLHPLPFSELIKAIPICGNYTKHVTIKLCRWLIWVVERIN